jgi:nucleotide-binding universal stress UspA family protein
MPVIRKIFIPLVDEYFVEAVEEFVATLKPAEDVLVLRVMTAIEPADSSSLSIFKESYREANELLDTVSRRLRTRFPNYKVESIVVEGKPKDSIVREAKDWSADLILLGPHTKKGMGRILFGSVAQSVIPDSPCSVVMLSHRRPTRVDSGSVMTEELDTIQPSRKGVA